MSTKLRLWKKQEKQIVKLLYRKGLLDFKLEQLYWEYYHVLNIQKHKHIYAPELYFSTIDYWGECNEPYWTKYNGKGRFNSNDLYITFKCNN